MELSIIIGAIAVIAILSLYFAYKNAPEIKEEPKQSYQVRRVVDFSKPPSCKLTKKDVIPVSTEAAITPKKKKKKYYNKKKKATLAESATPVAKRPVGRPRKTVE